MVVSDGPEGEISFGGIKMPNFEEVDHYNRNVANQLAAEVSAVPPPLYVQALLWSPNYSPPPETASPLP
jgi:hypothetical protein